MQNTLPHILIMAVASGQAGPVLAGPVFMGHFWNCACAGNEILALEQLHRAVTRACTMPATGIISNSTAQDADIPEMPHHPANYKFPKHIWAKESSVPCLPICLV